jgi:PAS domain S-box-containing protein
MAGARETQEGGADLRQRRILLAEGLGDAAARRCAAMERDGYAVVRAASASDALDAVRRDPAIDLVVLDPGLDHGLEGAEIARGLLAVRQVPLVFIGGRRHGATGARKEDVTPYGYIPADAGEDVLTDTVETALRLFEERRAARERGERTRALLSMIADWTWETDEQGVFTCCEGNVDKVLGYAPGEIVGKRPFDFIAPFDAARAKTVLSGFWKRREPARDVETWNLRKDGGTVCLLKSGIPIFDSGGVFKGYWGADKDITRRKRMEKVLEEEAIRRRILIEQSRDGIVVLEGDGGVYEANRAFTDMLGYTPEEVGGLHVWDWNVGRTPGESLAHLCATDAIGEYVERRYRRGDGSLLDVEISVNGAVCGGRKLVFCVCRDISERKRMEQELRAARDDLERRVRERTEELRRREQQFETLAANAPDIIARLDRDLRYTYVNPAVDRLLGLKPQDVIGKTDSDVFEAAVASRLREAGQKAFLTGAEQSVEFTIPAPKGMTSISGRLVPERDEAGTIHSLLVMGRDVTEQKRLEGNCSRRRRWRP